MLKGFTYDFSKARKPRRVRTPEGAKIFGQPEGTIITRDMIAAAKNKVKSLSSPRSDGKIGQNLSGTQKPKPAQPLTAKISDAIDAATDKESLQSVINEFAANHTQFTPQEADALMRKIQTRIDTLRAAKKANAQPVKPAQKPKQPAPAPKVPPKVETPQKPETPKTDWKAKIGEAKSSEDLKTIQQGLANDTGLSQQDWKKHATALHEKAQELLHAKEGKPTPQKREATKVPDLLNPNYTNTVDIPKVANGRLEAAKMKDWVFDLGVNQDLSQLEWMMDNVEDAAKHAELSPKASDALLTVLNERFKQQADARDQIDIRIMDMQDAGTLPEPSIDKVDPLLQTWAQIPMDRIDQGAPEITGRMLDDLATKKVSWDSLPISREIAAGTSLDNIKDRKNLLVAVLWDKKNFTTKQPRDAGTAECFIVTDKRDKSIHFFKAGENGGHTGMYGEDINEVFGSQLGKEAFPDLFLESEALGGMDENVTAVVKTQHLSDFTKRHYGGAKVETKISQRWNDDATFKEPDKPSVADPKNPMQILMFDYLTNQTDRHFGNIAVVHGKNGDTLVPMDQGGGFLANNRYQRDALAAGGVKIDPKHVNAPASVDLPEYLDFIGKTGCNAAVHELKAALDTHHINEVEATKLADEVIAKLRAVDYEAIVKRLLESYPDMDLYHRTHLMAGATIWKHRLERLEAKKLIQGVLK